MTTSVFLHVGLPKSGTTYLQAVLGSNKDRLRRRADLLYPGKTWSDQVRAARDVLEARRTDDRKPVPGAWKNLADEISRWDGDAVVSMEWLGSAEPHQARRIVESLAPARVEVIITARDLARTIPAAWQEFVQNYESWTWPEFLGSVTSENPRATPPGNLFWSQQDLGRVLAIWRDVLPPEQLHVVTLPPPGAAAGELWSRFASVLGIDGNEFDASGRGSNESLGLESAELMLRVNKVGRSMGIDWPVYNEMLKHALAKRGLSKRRHRESTLRLPPELEEWTRARTAQQVKAVEASGARVVGSLDELEPSAFAADGRWSTDDLDSDALLEAAVEGLVSLAKDRGAELARLRTAGPRPRGAVSARPAARDRARQCVVDLSERWTWLMPARRAYARTRTALNRRRR